MPFLPQLHKFFFPTQWKISLTHLKIGPTTHAWHIESAREITGAGSAFIRCKRKKCKAVKMESKQVGKKTETTSLDMVIFSRPCVCDPRDNGTGWCGKSSSECTAPSPWKQIMSQETSNANLNEISHPGKCHIYEAVALPVRRIFVSAEEILLSAGNNPDRLQQHGVCHIK